MDALTSQEIIDIIREAGLHRYGRRGFPHPRQNQFRSGQKQIPLLSMVRVRTYITADHRLMLSTARRSSAVFGFIMKMFGWTTRTSALKTIR